MKMLYINGSYLCIKPYFERTCIGILCDKTLFACNVLFEHSFTSIVCFCHYSLHHHLRSIKKRDKKPIEFYSISMILAMKTTLNVY